MVSSLIRLKDWVSLEDAAKHISEILQEEVNLSDIYRLALANRLNLAVYFPDRITARQVETDSRGFVQPVMDLNNQNVSMPGAFPETTEKLEVQTFKLRSIQGVYDLAVTYTGRREIENMYQLLTTGIELADRPRRPGIIIKGVDSKFYELIQSEDENADISGSRAHRKKLDIEIAEKNLDSDLQNLIIKSYSKLRSEFLERSKTKRQDDMYRPIPRLPDNTALVVRTSALAIFEKAISDAQQEKMSTAGEQSANSASYPWGTHNTKLLTLLSQAALKFWQLYDPLDPTTAQQINK